MGIRDSFFADYKILNKIGFFVLKYPILCRFVGF